MGIPKSEIAGLILIGGKSERMGEPKAIVSLAGRPMWEHAMSALTPYVSEILFLGSIVGFKPSPGGREIMDDPAGIGPLGGIVAGLEQSGYEHHLLLAVDYPLVPASFLTEVLRQAIQRSAVCGESSGILEPLVGYYHRNCATVMRQMIAEGEFRAHRLFPRVPSYVIRAAEMLKIDPAKWAHFNVNTPADLREAESRLRAGYPK
jgi:molybdopterin-guanine dinucleotide biosynthesis protein A